MQQTLGHKYSFTSQLSYRTSQTCQQGYVRLASVNGILPKPCMYSVIFQLACNYPLTSIIWRLTGLPRQLVISKATWLAIIHEGEIAKVRLLRETSVLVRWHWCLWGRRAGGLQSAELAVGHRQDLAHYFRPRLQHHTESSAPHRHLD